MKIIGSRILGAAVLVTIGLGLHARAGDKETALYTFNKTSGGYEPIGGLLMDDLGNIYGATSERGEAPGTIFELSPSSGGGWNYTVIYSFSSGTDYSPFGSLVMDRAGNLYGTTAGSSTTGEIFELSPSASGFWTETVLYAQSPGDGYGLSPVVIDAAGNLYGVNYYGSNDLGYVFELAHDSGGGWTFEDIFDFSGSDGSVPTGVTLDSSGNLYGATYRGGSSTNCALGCGVVFKLSLVSGTWVETVLMDFTGNNGSAPQAPLAIGPAGTIYGSASSGGLYGYGTVFELKLVSGVWRGRTLHNFKDAGGDGSLPVSGLVFDGGSLYGTTLSGGGGLGVCFSVSGTGCGSAFELTPSGGEWKENILHDFSGGRDGDEPNGIILDSSGNVFRTAAFGGSQDDGLIFELSSASK